MKKFKGSGMIMIFFIVMSVSMPVSVWAGSGQNTREKMTYETASNKLTKSIPQPSQPTLPIKNVSFDIQRLGLYGGIDSSPVYQIRVDDEGKVTLESPNHIRHNEHTYPGPSPSNTGESQEAVNIVEVGKGSGKYKATFMDVPPDGNFKSRTIDIFFDIKNIKNNPPRVTSIKLDVAFVNSSLHFQGKFTISNNVIRGFQWRQGNDYYGNTTYRYDRVNGILRLLQMQENQYTTSNRKMERSIIETQTFTYYEGFKSRSHVRNYSVTDYENIRKKTQTSSSYNIWSTQGDLMGYYTPPGEVWYSRNKTLKFPSLLSLKMAIERTFRTLINSPRSITRENLDAAYNSLRKLSIHGDGPAGARSERVLNVSPPRRPGFTD